MTSNHLGDANELARRFVECKGWRWLPGMLAMHIVEPIESRRLVYPAKNVNGKSGWATVIDGNAIGIVVDDPSCLPDLSDAATRGAILELVRVAWGDPLAYVGYFAPHWKVIGSHQHKTENPASWGCLLGRGDAEIEALLAALEGAS